MKQWLVKTQLRFKSPEGARGRYSNIDKENYSGAD